MDDAPYFTEEHVIFRKTVRQVAEKELRPHTEAWEAAEEFPREVFLRLGELGFLGIRFDSSYGGSGLDYWYTVILCEELVRSYNLGLAVSVLVQTEMATAAINDVGTPEQKEEFLAPAVTGEKIAALGVTEPGVGSDVANLSTTARRVEGDYVINGSKTFISNGTRADFVTLAVRTGGAGAHGISLVIFPTDVKGFTVGRKLKKMGTKSGDLAELAFDDCRIPARYLLGEENKGFSYIMKHFQGERLVLASFANGIMQIMLEEALRYGSERKVFGAPVIQHQVWRHRLADVMTQMEASKWLTYRACDRLNRGVRAEREISMAKLFACELVRKVAGECLQIHGGYGYMEDYLICRLYRDVAAFPIGAGTSEVMREIIAKEAGLYPEKIELSRFFAATK
jgi:citronellyl-CoA dehydrogenase